MGTLGRLSHWYSNANLAGSGHLNSRFPKSSNQTFYANYQVTKKQRPYYVTRLHIPLRLGRDLVKIVMGSVADAGKVLARKSTLRRRPAFKNVYLWQDRPIHERTVGARGTGRGEYITYDVEPQNSSAYVGRNTLFSHFGTPQSRAPRFEPLRKN